jgi:hypothetical protein
VKIDTFARTIQASLALSFVALAALVQACGGPGEQAGQSCAAPAECYPEVDPADLQGEVLCLDKVAGGYCTHLCVTDADCCAVPGECQSGHPQVCSPFESTGQMMCFLSCEATVIGDYTEATYCQDFANAAFGCRSSGGGTENRKVCVP